MIIMLVQAVGQIPIVFLITPLHALFPIERYPLFFFTTGGLCLSLFFYITFFFKETAGLTDKEKKALFSPATIK